MELKNFFAQDDQGNKLPGAQCYLYLRGTESPAPGARKATGVPLENPFTADSNGLIQLAAPNGLYDLRVISDGRDYRIRLQFNDVSESLALALAAALDAQASSDAATVNADIKDSTDQGLVTTAEDEQFQVVSADGLTVTRYRHDPGPVATPVASFPSAKAVLERFRDGRGPAYAKHGDGYGFNRWLAYNDGSFGTNEAHLGPNGVRLSSFELKCVGANALAVRDAYGYYSVRVKAGSNALPQFPGFKVIEDVAKGMEGVAIEKTSKVLAVRDSNGYYAMSLTPDSFAAKGAGVNEAGASEEQVKTAMSLIRDTRSRGGLRKMQVAAHRGFISQAPQNTLMAFSTALQRGADVLELDVKFSSDDVAYVFHDLTVDALTSGTGSFRSLTAAQIDALTFKQLSGTIFEQSVRIPRFSEYLQWAREESAYSLIELKDLPTLAHADTLLQLIDDAQLLELTTIASINFSELAYVRSRYADVPLSWLISATDYASKVLTASPLAPVELSADAASLQANPGIVRSAKAAGLGISAWGVNTLAAAKRLERLGVNSIISDVSLRVDS